MNRTYNRRKFLQHTVGCAAFASGLARAEGAWAADGGPSKAAEHTLSLISGSPRERGREYGRTFNDRIHAFLEKEIYLTFEGNPSSKDELLRYAGACAAEIQTYCPIVWDELEGMAQATGLNVEEHVLLTLHEELYHRGVLPKLEHCTVLAAGPPDTADGNAYVGQTWDWMASVYGLSDMLHWQRSEGPSLLCYALQRAQFHHRLDAFQHHPARGPRRPRHGHHESLDHVPLRLTPGRPAERLVKRPDEVRGIRLTQRRQDAET